MSSVATPTTAVRLPAPELYAERRDQQESWLDGVGTAVAGLPVLLFPGLQSYRLSHIVRAAGRHAASLRELDDAALAKWRHSLWLEIRQNRFTYRNVARSFALIREVAVRTTGMRHYDVQLLGGYAMLKGMLAEMDTGEGKTLTATLPAATAALAGIPVHVVTVNDYLAHRDAETMGPIYRALGLTVGHVVHGMSPEDRREAYLCDVTYCSNKEITFDYLRDRMTLGRDTSNLRLKTERLYGESSRSRRLVMRGLHFAIVDEADSVLIDEARTPLIISTETDPAEEQEQAERALVLIEGLERDTDFTISAAETLVELTDAGRERLAEIAAGGDDFWSGRIRREEAARQALTAVHLFHRDEHYLVRDGGVEIIDEYTGRVMEGRSWGEGLHQLVEVKEGCRATGQKLPVARMTYQRFLRRYRRLAGMTGTAREVAGELWSVYRLPVVTVPTHRPLRRTRMPDRIFDTADRKWREITRRIAELHRRGQPVLLGTRSVATSEIASGFLSEAGLEHRILNAAQDEHEAQIIAEAGQKGRITIATNMAGRGVDISLDEGVMALGGLWIIMSERHSAGRIDRQLLGRSGRHGEPGCNEVLLSLEDPLLADDGRSLSTFLAGLGGPARHWTGRKAFDRAQRRAERLHSRMRRQLVKLDRQLGTLLAFSGRME